MQKIVILMLVFAYITTSCNAQDSPSKEILRELKKDKKNTEQEINTKIKNIPFETLEIDGHKVDIQNPDNEIIGNILVLPGWDFSRTDWCKNSDLCKKALAKGYRLILPEMGRSIYSADFYAETLVDWKKFPNKKWVVEQMIPYLQKERKIFIKKEKNFIVGLSTGGRGVALLSLALPEIWTACASLSGDFDQSLLPNDRLMIGYYGSYQKFKNRWLGEDNPLQQAKNFKTPIYLGHSKQDNIVPINQTQLFYEVLKKNQPKLKIKLNLIDGGHDYKYWNKEVENILQFFGEF